MEKKYLDKLTSEELKALFRKNEYLQEMANELHRINIMFWVEEEFGVFRNAMSDWEIGFDCYNYFKVKDSSLFIESYKNYIDIYSSNTQTIELVNEANEYLQKNNEDDDYEEKIEQFANKLKNTLINHFNGCLVDCNDEDDLIEYFDNNDQLKKYYILDHKSYIIYEEIIKSYR